MIVLFIAHRGFRIGVVENTMDAFERSIEMGMDYVELDVHVMDNGLLVVMHDDPSRRGPKTPLLKTVLADCKGKIKFMIDLKGKGTGSRIGALVATTGIPGPDLVFASSHLPELGVVINDSPCAGVRTCLNITSCKEYTVDDLLDARSRGALPLPFTMVSLRSSLVDREYIEKCHELGILALCWDFLSCDDPVTRCMELASMGIDGILFDDPFVVDSVRKGVQHP